MSRRLRIWTAGIFILGLIRITSVAAATVPTPSDLGVDNDLYQVDVKGTPYLGDLGVLQGARPLYVTVTCANHGIGQGLTIRKDTQLILYQLDNSITPPRFVKRLQQSINLYEPYNSVASVFKQGMLFMSPHSVDTIARATLPAYSVPPGTYTVEVVLYATSPTAFSDTPLEFEMRPTTVIEVR